MSIILDPNCAQLILKGAIWLTLFVCLHFGGAGLGGVEFTTNETKEEKGCSSTLYWYCTIHLVLNFSFGTLLLKGQHQLGDTKFGPRKMFICFCKLFSRDTSIDSIAGKGADTLSGFRNPGFTSIQEAP